MNPLAGRTIVITRAASQAREFVEALEGFGAQVLSCPTIEIRDPDSYESLDESIDHLYGYDWLIFTSANAVDFFLRRLVRQNKQISDLDELQVCAIGSATAERLHTANIHVDLIPSQSQGEGVFSTLSDFVGGPERLRGLNILFPRAAVARDQLPKSLEAAGARVDIVTAYQTTVPADLDRGKFRAMLAGGTDCIAFTSSSTVKNLALMFDTQDLGSILKGITVACIGDVTSETARDYGLSVEIQPTEFNVAALAREIAHYYSST